MSRIDVELGELARGHYENFPVLSWLVPRELRRHFARVYWFCRTADDLADEHDGSAEARRHALMKLRAFRERFAMAAQAGHAPIDDEATSKSGIRHVDAFGSLARTIHEKKLSIEPFHSLLDAFEQDQLVTRYASLEQLLDYCTRSANPVGRIVLQLGGLDPASPSSAMILGKSDTICTALQLVNHCQDVRRDALERDRIYIPLSTELSEDEIRKIAERSKAGPSDAATTGRWITPVLAHARRLFSSGQDLPEMLRHHPNANVRKLAPVVHLMLGGGLHIQMLCEQQPGTLLRRRPYVSKISKMKLLLRSMIWSLTSRVG